jgi:uncharacterized protein YjbI with pentapeptide repeats
MRYSPFSTALRGEANASLHQVYIKRSNAPTNESVGPEEEGVYHMGDQQLANLLKQGVTTWNDWRKEHSTLPPDLSRADLSRAVLNNADLSRANLCRANLLGTLQLHLLTHH